MITATFISNTNRTQVHLKSSNHNRTILVTKFTTGWQGKYTTNGQRINKGTYQDIIDHLVKKGW